MQDGHEVRIVTVSRESGAGGAYLASSLGLRLGWPVVDRALMEEVARRLHAPLSDVQGMDEYVGGLLERVGKVFARGTPELMLAPVGPDPELVARVEQEIIRNVAESPPVIVVGRGAQCVLHGRPDTLHVRLVAPLEVRAKRLAESRGLAPEPARELARRTDLEGDRYVRHHFHCDRGEPHLYDVQVNTGSISLDVAVDLIVHIVESFQAPAR